VEIKMAIKPELINQFIESIQNANMQTFSSKVSHLFEHLEEKIKDNVIYNKYESEREKWKNWPEKPGMGNWKLPSKLDEAKSLTYDLYKSISEREDKARNLVVKLFPSEGGIDFAINSFNLQFLQYFIDVLNEIINANPETEKVTTEKVIGNTVFIIHGHDNSLKTETQLLLTRAGVNNIVLHEQPDKGRTIIDKLIDESSNSNYAIALLSPDDVLKDGENRARQNVILEIGYFIGLLGKERVRLIKKGEIDIPSDLSGILYEKYDDGGAWKIKICKELQAVGIFVDLKAVVDNS
jgi:predicted nucleotide-binding protein